MRSLPIDLAALSAREERIDLRHDLGMDVHDPDLDTRVADETGVCVELPSVDLDPGLLDLCGRGSIL